jgi:hypothetical protein
LQQYPRKKRTTVTRSGWISICKDSQTKKWGGKQYCKRGDRLVNNQDDVYAVVSKYPISLKTESVTGVARR